jgi:hypothetical protein
LSKGRRKQEEGREAKRERRMKRVMERKRERERERPRAVFDRWGEQQCTEGVEVDVREREDEVWSAASSAVSAGTGVGEVGAGRVEGLTGRSAAAVQHMLLEENLRIQCGSLPRRKSLSSPGTSSMSSGFTLQKSNMDSGGKGSKRSLSEVGYSGKYTINNDIHDVGINDPSSQHFEISEKIHFRGNNIEISESDCDLDRDGENGYLDENGVRTKSFPYSNKLKTEKSQKLSEKDKIKSKDSSPPPPPAPTVWEIG